MGLLADRYLSKSGPFLAPHTVSGAAPVPRMVSGPKLGGGKFILGLEGGCSGPHSGAFRWIPMQSSALECIGVHCIAVHWSPMQCSAVRAQCKASVRVCGRRLSAAAVGQCIGAHRGAQTANTAASQPPVWLAGRLAPPAAKQASSLLWAGPKGVRSLVQINDSQRTRRASE